jgi:hypothetical protein
MSHRELCECIRHQGAEEIRDDGEAAGRRTFGDGLRCPCRRNRSVVTVDESVPLPGPKSRPSANPVTGEAKRKERQAWSLRKFRHTRG